MDFIKKNIISKIFIIFLLLALVLAGANYFLNELVAEYVGRYFGVILIGFFFVIAFGAVFLNVHRPLKKVFNEMKALLTGRQYKKIFTKRIDEIGVLAHFFNEVTKNIERISVDVAEGKRMKSELSIGSDIQRRIIPKQMPTVSGITLFGNMRPASEIGGDSFDIISAKENTLVYVGDVTGHGLPAALIMMMVNTMIRTLSEIYSNGYDIIVNTNRILKQRIEPRRFMTCVLMRWNSQEQKLYYTGAGHEHILIFRKEDGKCKIRQTGGIALGMVPDISKIIREEAIALEQGDFVVLYSDGIIEAKNMQGEMFSLPRLKKAVEDYAPSASPEQLFTYISKDFGAFVGEQIQEDDITLIAIQRT